ncbi:MAG: DoxX family protein [Flavobacteriales bacterium]|nr:DoxX family protein [Flavobacteriales bacterium]
MKKITIAYWIVNGLLAAFMIFSSLDNVVTGEQSVAFIHDKMGYPVYFIPWIGVAKILGAIAILLPMLPARVKEWAYFGFFMDLSTAIYSFIALREHVSGYAPMFIFVGVLIAAYILHHKRLKAAA